jgi:hypothetical protein
VPRRNLLNRLEELKVPFNLRDSMTRLYENVISKFRNIEDWSEKINCNIGVEQGCNCPQTFFSCTLTS